MKTYNVYSHSTKGIEIVNLGFSLPALLFSFWWAFLKRLYGTGTILLFIFLIALSSQQDPSNFVLTLFSWGLFLIINVLLSIKGNLWRKSKLEKRGFQYLGKIQATSYTEARKKFISDGVQTQS
jgi:hypothetical protein